MINSITLQISVVQDELDRIVRRRIAPAAELVCVRTSSCFSAEQQDADPAAIHAPEVAGSDEEEDEEDEGEDKEEDQEEGEEEVQDNPDEETTDEDGMWRRHEETSSEPEPEPSPTPRGVGSSCV